jgi:elongation factor P
VASTNDLKNGMVLDLDGQLWSVVWFQHLQYLYHDGSGFVFMDTSTYDQLTIPDETVGEAKNYLLEEQVATVALHNGTPLYIELPASVELVITYTEPGLQGDRSTGGTKPATVETGLQIQVPLFLTTGEKVKVDTRSGEYLSRVGS